LSKTRNERADFENTPGGRNVGETRRGFCRNWLTAEKVLSTKKANEPGGTRKRDEGWKKKITHSKDTQRSRQKVNPVI